MGITDRNHRNGKAEPALPSPGRFDASDGPRAAKLGGAPRVGRTEVLNADSPCKHSADSPANVMSLPAAINDLLAFAAELDRNFHFGGDRRRRFLLLDRAVWVEACRLGLKSELPAGRSGVNDRLGLTNLPIQGYLDRHGRSRILSFDRWRHALLGLRDLAEVVIKGNEVHRRGTTANPISSCVPAAGTRLRSEDVPAEFRDGGQAGGDILTTSYLTERINWLLDGPYLSKHHGTGKELTTYIKIGRQHAYLYSELLVLRDRKTTHDSGERR
jgi:hypothetical protein